MSDQPTMQVDGMPSEGTVTLTVSIQLPKKITLDVQRDEEGRLWPAIGLSWQRLIDAGTLVTAGAEVIWRLTDGTELDATSAQALIDARQADVNTGYMPSFNVTEEDVPHEPSAA